MPTHFRVHRACLLFAVALTVLSCTDAATRPSRDITRERAIEIARQHVTFEPTSTEATAAVRERKQVWVVTFRRADGTHGGLGQLMEVTIDRQTGTVTSIAMS